jgi:hypothetical protein
MESNTNSQLYPLELDHRIDDGVEVTLFWSRYSSRVWVAVYDSRSDEWFEVDVRPEDALDAFRHPYAYAALAGVEYHELVGV